MALLQLDNLKATFAKKVSEDMDKELLSFMLLSPEEQEVELERRAKQYEERKVYIKTSTGDLACCRVNAPSVIYKVSGHEMTDEVLPDAKFGRWATSFDL